MTTRMDYNLRAQTTGKRATNQGTKRKETAREMPTQSEPNATASATPDIANVSTDSTVSTPHVTDSSTGETRTPIPAELIAFMGEIKALLSDHSSKINSKLDMVVSEITTLKRELSETKNTVSVIEASLTATSDRVLAFEKEDLPQMHETLSQKIRELDEKITLSEIHERKQNLLIYGVATKANENIYDTVQPLFSHFMNIPKEDVVRVPLVNIHRLPPPARTQGSSQQPPAIIVRFARMADRDRLLHGYENRFRQRRSDPNRNHGNDQPPPPTPFERVTIRTDLPPKMKRERGRLASIAYQLRKDDHLATRIKVVGTKVILQTRKPARSDGTPTNWSSWSE